MHFLTIQLHLFFIFSLCSHYVSDLIKKLTLCLMEVSVLLKIKFGHIQVSVPKIDIPTLKTDYINPWDENKVLQHIFLCVSLQFRDNLF